MRISSHLIYIHPRGEPRFWEQSVVPGLAASGHALLPPLWKGGIARCDWERSSRLRNDLVGNSIAWTSGLVLPGNSSVAKEGRKGWTWWLLVLQTSDLQHGGSCPAANPFLADAHPTACIVTEAVSSPWRNMNVAQGGRGPFRCSASSDWKISLHLPLVRKEALVQIILPFICL